MPIWQRSLKLVLAFCLAVFLANQLALPYALSAGIIALLTVTETRRSTLKIAAQRFCSAILGLMIAAGLFWFLGYNLWIFLLYLLLYIPLVYTWGLASGLVPSTVLVSHLYLAQTVSASFLLNELSLFLLGAGMGLLVNSYMPSQQGRIAVYHRQVEESLKEILGHFSQLLAGKCQENQLSALLAELDELLVQALRVVYADWQNQVFSQTNQELHYFTMRENQSQLLSQMALQFVTCDLRSPESRLLARIFAHTAGELSQENPAHDLLLEIEETRASFRQRPLPTSREEFETRAVLFQLLNDLERFIQMKVTFHEDNIARD